MGSATKAGLIGRWRIVRRIEDQLGPDATFEGEGVFAPAGDALLWEETGALRMDAGPPMTATRSYRWRFADARVFVDYADASPFHDFDPAEPMASHLCGADTYDVIYTFDLPASWTATWRVIGPRKDYVSISEMTRL